MTKWKENIQNILKMEILDWKQRIKMAYRKEKQLLIMNKEKNIQHVIINKGNWKESILNITKAEI